MTIPSSVLIVLVLTFSLVPSSWADIKVKVRGVSGAQLDNVNDFLSVRKLADSTAAKKDRVTDYAVQRAHAEAQNEIEQALMPFGFYSPDIEGTLARSNNDWEIEYKVSTGPVTLISDVELLLNQKPREDAQTKQALKRLKIAVGQPLNHPNYTKLKQQLLRQSISSGHLDARYELAEIRVETKAERASIHLHLVEGERYLFGPIELIQDAVDQSFAQRFVTINPGDSFDTEKLVALQLALSDSGYFDNVAFELDRAEAEDYRIPVKVTTLKKKSQRYTARVGIGTDTGPRARLGLEFRRLSGRGNKFRSDLQVSNLKSTLSAEYSVPIKNVATDRQTFNSRYDRADIGDTDSTLYALGARRFDQWKGLSRQLYIEFENETFSTVAESSSRSELLIVGVSVSRQHADNSLFPRKGFSAHLDIHGASNFLLSETSFIQSTLNARGVYPLGKQGRILARLELGYNAVDDVSELPPTQRFFTGGDRTVRGYGFEQLSPLDVNGDSVGGQYLLGASVEADYFFDDRYGIAAFVDSGNAVNDLSDSLKSSAGLGFRYRTPVGVLRLDVAKPFDDSEDSYRLHFSLSPDL